MTSTRGGVNNGSGGGSSNTIGNGHNGANGFKDGWDALVKIMFAPCVNIGGVPREEMEGATTDTYTPSRRGLYSSHAGRGVTAGANGNNGWGASVPFEVSASSLLGQSLVMSSSSLDKTSTELHHHQQQQQQQLQTNVHPLTSPQQKKKQQQQPQLQLLDPPGVPGVHTNNNINTTLAHHHSAPLSTSNYSPWEQRKAQSRAKLRQLGARHQLASGIPGESLADTARPLTPGGEEDDQQYHHHHHAAAASSTALVPAQSSSSSSQQQQQAAELVDFDDGISAISSHTLEEMERRREQQSQHQQQHKVMKKAAATTTVLRLHPLDFSQIIDEDCEWKDDQVVVVAAATASTEEFRHEYHHHQGGGGEGRKLDVVEEVDRTEVVFGIPFYEESSTTKGIPMTSPSDLYRVPSTRTHQTLNTTVTEDTHEFEDMCQRHEALYWTNQDQVASTERKSVSLRGVPTHQQQQSQYHQDHHRSSTTTSSSGRMSIEERARRLRELSRSRSRSDGSGSVSTS